MTSKNVFLKVELEKILNFTKVAQYKEHTFIGDSLYIIGEKNRLKVYFIKQGYSYYESLVMVVIDKDNGEIDRKGVNFADEFGKLPTKHPSFEDGVYMAISDCGEYLDWHIEEPKLGQYWKLADYIDSMVTMYL